MRETFLVALPINVIFVSASIGYPSVSFYQCCPLPKVPPKGGHPTPCGRRARAVQMFPLSLRLLLSHVESPGKIPPPPPPPSV